jgi:hypothetical protein
MFVELLNMFVGFLRFRGLSIVFLLNVCGIVTSGILMFVGLRIFVGN